MPTAPRKKSVNFLARIKSQLPTHPFSCHTFSHFLYNFLSLHTFCEPGLRQAQPRRIYLCPELSIPHAVPSWWWRQRQQRASLQRHYYIISDEKPVPVSHRHMLAEPCPYPFSLEPCLVREFHRTPGYIVVVGTLMDANAYHVLNEREWVAMYVMWSRSNGLSEALYQRLQRRWRVFCCAMEEVD